MKEEKEITRGSFTDVYMIETSQFFSDVRLDNPDGLAFAQMGFRTRLYSHMLHEETKLPEKDRFNKDFQKRERDMWFFLPGISTIRKRAQSRTSKTKRKKKKTRGIILSVDASRFIYTCHFLAMLRNHHKSSLPVEIFYMGDSDLPQSMRDHFKLQYDAVTVDLSEENLFDNTFTKIGGYAIKPYALLATSFSEVFMADADAVLLANPDTFFNQKGYRDSGTLFFQDRHVDHKSEGGHQFVKEQMGHRNISIGLSQSAFWKEKLRHWQESGVIVVDRSRPEVLSSLLFAAWQNGKLMRDTVLDRHFWGDKESYWLSFELSGFPYYMVNHSCGAIGREHATYADANQGFCSEHPLHFFDHQKGDRTSLIDPNDQKRKLGKPAWFNGSLRLNKYHGDLHLLDPTDDTIWAMNGTWTMHGDRWCLTNYKRFGIHEYKLGVTLGRLGWASREGERLSAAVTG